MNQEQELIINHLNPQSRQKILSGQPLLSSQKLNWAKLEFNYYLYNSHKVPQHCQANDNIGICLNDISYKEEQLNGNFNQSSPTFGSLTVLPKGSVYSASWKETLGFIIISIRPEKLREFAPEFIDPEHIELLPVVGQNLPDYLVTGIIMTFWQELETGLQQSNPLIEHLENALLAHLLQNHCSKQYKFKSFNGLPSYKLKLTLDYIHDNLANDIKLDDIAKLLDISPGYFCRLFRESIGIPPYRYILQQRCHKAQELLDHNNLSLAEIAQLSGFNSSIQLHRHFKKFFGLSPQHYRDSP